MILHLFFEVNKQQQHLRTAPTLASKFDEGIKRSSGGRLGEPNSFRTFRDGSVMHQVGAPLFYALPRLQEHCRSIFGALDDRIRS
jgi:hypothetical protein